MSISYEGIGQWAATFSGSNLTAGHVVKMGASNGTVAACSAEDGFAGVVLAVSRDGAACTVALGGIVTVAYTGQTAPSLGWNTLSANASGGVAVDEDGRDYRVLAVDTTGKKVTFVL